MAGFDYHRLMDQCEALLIAVFQEMECGRDLVWQTKPAIHLPAPWERITVAEAFSQYASVSLTQAMETDRFDEILTQQVEPHLGVNRPAFLYDYPAKLAALSKIKKSDPAVAERFELYIGGMEIANGFSELTGVDEQRRRFEEAQTARSKKNWSRYDMPEKFLTALASMPPAAGIALGIDRLAMLVADTDCIDDVVTFEPEHL
ncbi:MAG: amino acid--tRNA ligase-related protein [Smithellaceae bacterium]